MKRILLLAALLVLISGCATYVESDGNRYAALSESQQKYLVTVSRQTLVKYSKKGVVSKNESEYAKRHAPEIRIKYRGDRYGSAVVMWRTPGRQLEFHFEDDLTARYPVCHFAIRDIPPQERRIQPDKSIPGR